MTPRENLVEAIAKMEGALAATLAQANNVNAPLDNLESLLKLIIKKEILLEMLLEEATFKK